MGFIANTINFLIAVALALFAWLVYLWVNDGLSRITVPVLKETLGALLGIGLFAVVAALLYFFSLPLAMGTVAIMFLAFLAYIAGRARHSLLVYRANQNQ